MVALYDEENRLFTYRSRMEVLPTLRARTPAFASILHTTSKRSVLAVSHDDNFQEAFLRGRGSGHAGGPTIPWEPFGCPSNGCAGP